MTTLEVRTTDLVGDGRDGWVVIRAASPRIGQTPIVTPSRVRQEIVDGEADLLNVSPGPAYVELIFTGISPIVFAIEVPEDGTHDIVSLRS